MLIKLENQANYIKEFLKHMVKTTKCFGLLLIVSVTLFYNSILKIFFDEVTIELIRNILQTNWGTLQTKVIDFSKLFLLFDDHVLGLEGIY